MLCTTAINTSNTTRTQTGAVRSISYRIVSYRISHTVEEPLDVALEDVGDLLCRAADGQQTGADGARAAAGEPPDARQYAAVLQRLHRRPAH